MPAPACTLLKHTCAAQQEAHHGEHRGAHQQERQRRHQRRRDSPADAVDEDVEQPQLPVGLAEHEAEAHHDGKGCHALGAVEEMLKELLHGRDLLRHIQQELGDDGQQRGQRHGLRHPAGLERVDDEKCQRRKGHDALRHGAFSLPGKLSVVQHALPALARPFCQADSLDSVSRPAL